MADIIREALCYCLSGLAKADFLTRLYGLEEYILEVVLSCGIEVRGFALLQIGFYVREGIEDVLAVEDVPTSFAVRMKDKTTQPLEHWAITFKFLELFIINIIFKCQRISNFLLKSVLTVLLRPSAIGNDPVAPNFVYIAVGTKTDGLSTRKLSAMKVKTHSFSNHLMPL